MSCELLVCRNSLSDADCENRGLLSLFVTHYSLSQTSFAATVESDGWATQPHSAQLAGQAMLVWKLAWIGWVL
jgi:hypothetical protein